MEMCQTDQNEAAAVISTHPLTDTNLSTIDNLLHDGRFYDAYQASVQFGPLKQWTGARGRATASSLAAKVGGYRLSDWIDVKAFREHPQDFDTQVNYAYYLLVRKAPLFAWEHLDEIPASHLTEEQQVDRLLLKASILTEFRDFAKVEDCLEETSRLDCPKHRLLIQKSLLAKAKDDYELALGFAEESRQAKTRHIAALREISNNLVYLRREAEATALLEDTLKTIQSSSLLWRLIELRWEESQYKEVLGLLDLYEKWSPLCEKNESKWMAGRRCDAHFHLGNVEQAISFAEKQGDAYYLDFAKRLRASSVVSATRRLAVHYVRQHHNTCGPATLSALSTYWDKTIPQEKIVDAIWYDGTRDSQERHWALEQGFTVREFKYSWETTKALIDRGIPFALTTTFATGSHLQAIYGYNLLQEVLLVRDPSDPSNREYISPAIAETHASTGPRCIILIPREKEALLSGIPLPEVEGYDILFEVRQALDQNNRDRALAAQKRLDDLLPGHRLALAGQYAIACHDGNLLRQLECTEVLLAQFPRQLRLQLQYVRLLRDLGRESERREWLEKKLASSDREPLLLKEYAIDLADDARRHAETLRLLRYAHRHFPRESSVLAQIGRLYRTQRHLVEACDIYRFACCLNISSESLAEDFFSVSRQADQDEESLIFLRDRFKKLGDKDGGPGKTLFKSLELIKRTHEAFPVIEEALQRRPKDENLLLFAAESYSRLNQKDRAHQLISLAENIAPRGLLYYTQATIAENERQWEKALELWRKLLEVEPDSEIAHSSIAELLFKLQGKEVALDFLQQQAKQFPKNFEIQKTLYQWQREYPSAAEKTLRHIIDVHPNNVWTRIELTHLLRRKEALDEALTLARETVIIDPCWVYSLNALASVERARQDTAAARETYRKALKLDIDCTPAIESLIEMARTTEEKEAEIEFIFAEMENQTVWGDGYFALQTNAGKLIPADRLLSIFERGRCKAPQFWQRWAVTIDQLQEMQQYDRALLLAQEAAKKFPLLPALHRRLAHVFQKLKRIDDAIASLKKALSINPFWPSPVFDLCEIYREQNRYDLFRSTVEEALAHNPNNGRLHGFLAEAVKELVGPQEALPHLEAALKIDPDYSWGWARLTEWCSLDVLLDTAQQIAQCNPGNPYSWMGMSEIYEKLNRPEDGVAALDRALACAPRNAVIHEQKACMLANIKRYDEALAACAPKIFGSDIPALLVARAAWIEAQKGNRIIAIEKMRNALTIDPGNYWGWCRLADWLHDSEQYTQELEAITHMRQLRPDLGVPLGYSAEAKLALKDRTGAKDDLQEACRLDPGYQFGWNTLARLQYEDEELGKFEKTVEVLEQKFPGPAAQCHRALLHIAKKESKPALQAISQLCFVHPDNTRSLSQACAAFKQQGSDAELERTLYTALSESSSEKPTNAHVGRLWVQSWTSRRVWKEQSKIRKIDLSTPAGHEAFITYLEALGENRHVMRLRWQLLRKRHLFKNDVTAWGTVVYALTKAQHNLEAILWMKNWQERKDVQPWMLSNLILAQVRCGMRRSAELTVAHSLDLAPDHTRNHLLTWRALFCILKPNITEARKALLELPKQNSKEFYGFLAALARWVDTVESTTADDRKQIFQSQKNEIDSIRVQNPNLQMDRLAKHYWILTTRAAAKASHSWLTYARTFLPYFDSPGGPSSTTTGIPRWVFFIIAFAIIRSCTSH